ncbi:MAG: transketolase [Bacteroidetes bacterium]|nr:transketolase [Bacteroidota bacterium]
MTYEELLRAITAEDDRVVIMTAENRAAIRSLQPHLGDRLIDVGISEMTMIGAAAGLALRGRIPVVHALATFLTLRAFEFIRTDVGISGLPVKLIGAVPGFLSDGNGPTHQALEDIALMRGIPPIQVFAPSDNDDMLAALPHILASPDPAYVRFNNMPAHVVHTPFKIGKAEVLTEGTDVAILTYGFLLREVLAAETLLRAEGLTCRVINLRSLKPLDEEVIASAARDCTLLVTVEDHFVTGGLTTMLAEVFLRRRLIADVLPIALEHRWFKPATLDRVLEYEGFTGSALTVRILRALENDRRKGPILDQMSSLFKTYL